MRFLENLPFWEGKGRERVQGNFFGFVCIGPNGNCLQILGSISPKKQTDVQIHRHFIALRDRMEHHKPFQSL